MKRKRIIRQKFKKGDVIKSALLGVPKKHVCIILEDEGAENHVKCISVCNLTGSVVPNDEYSIDVSQYEFPESWFDKKKHQTWLRCNEVDCVYKHDIENCNKVGNILELFPDLWSEVCRTAYNCPISKKLENICDCDYELIEKQIEFGLLEPEDCGCN